MRTFYWGIAVSVIAGCGDGGPGMCMPLEGTFLVETTELSGDCGPFDDFIVVLPLSPAEEEASQCVFDARSVSDDRCRIDYEQTCPGVVPGVELSTTVGFVEFEPDGSGSIDVSEWCVRGEEGVRLCCSIYRTRWRRI